MKRLGIGVLMLALSGVAAEAQPRPRNKPANKITAAPVQDTTSGRFEQSSSQPAFAPVATERFTIADPFLTLYNERAAGSMPLNEPVRPIPNVPRLRYGIAHGHLLFYNTTATTNGGSTGTGTVGTGSSLGSVGTNGVAQGVNGKNPFAGPGIYGNRVRYSGQPVNLPPMRLGGKEDQRP